MGKLSKAQQERQHARSADGRYCEFSRGEIAFHDAEFSGQDMERLRAFEQGKTIPAGYRAIGGGKRGARSWWDGHEMLAERAAKGDRKVRRLADRRVDPDGTERRVLRRTYKGSGVEIQMASARAIRLELANNPGQSLDVPATVTIAGSSVDCFVRVHPAPGGRYRTEVLGVPDSKASRAAAEGVAATLEARRVTTGMREAGNLVAKSEQRRQELSAQVGLTTRPLRHPSSFIEAADYSEQLGISTIQMNGKQYAYRIPREMHEQVFNSVSPGTLYNLVIKPTGKDTRVETVTCPRCQVTYVPGEHRHQCLNAPVGGVRATSKDGVARSIIGQWLHDRRRKASQRS